jgi:hypothetical protein
MRFRRRHFTIFRRWLQYAWAENTKIEKGGAKTENTKQVTCKEKIETKGN